MKNFNIVKAAGAVTAASVLLLSCEKNLPDTVKLPAGKRIPVEISIPSSGTRVTEIGDEDRVNHLQVFAFRSDGALDAYSSADDSQLVLECTSGEKEFVAVVNAPEIDGIQNLAQLEAVRSELSDNSTSGFVMSGTASETVSSGNASVEITVSRLVARVSVSSITNSLAMPGYSDTPITLKAIYISNVAADAYYLDAGEPSSWYNKFGSKNDFPSLLCDDGLNIGISHGSAYDTSHYFYCYANPTDTDSSEDTWCPRYTRLVIETVIRNVTYYYPIDLPQIAANHTYDVSEVIITRLGSTDPDKHVEVGTVSVTIKVKDWETGNTTEITI